MCDVHQPVQMNQHEMSLGSNALSERDEVTFTKQIEKKKMLTPYKILIGLAIFCVIAMLSYKLYTLAYAGAAANKILNSHSKFIQNADSSSDPDSGSQTGSSSSKSSSSSDRPIGVAKPAGKDVISSGYSGSGGDDEGPSEEDNDGEKRKRNMNMNKMSDGTSTEGDSEEDSAEDEEDEDSDEIRGQGMIWPNNGGSSMPLVGSQRPGV